ncbi:Flp pilus assembly protein TadB [Weissella uvarum]|uniref:hypothetical protein n=1 Tax=Lactobacillaceae TaxID=33958 RepID=UPI0019606A9E|nr:MULTISPECIES: hypothetical protein [Lactobacillaceae]MBM7617279.1 Flp pilus assembly protein TadB [Weissella uvarum]MCM0595217.1 hypothetical protein [Weissella uvarum]MCM0601479.1 hypothetical protein [Periweissella ghanensis]
MSKKSYQRYIIEFIVMAVCSLILAVYFACQYDNVSNENKRQQTLIDSQKKQLNADEKYINSLIKEANKERNDD